MRADSPLLVRFSRWRAGLWLGCLSAVILLLLWSGDLFAQSRLRLSDIYFAPAPSSGSIVIVAIDDASLETYGRVLTEWPRALYAELINQIGAARVIAFDVLFDVPKGGDIALAAAIQQARESEARTRTIMPIVAVQRVFGGAGIAQFANVMRPDATLASAVDNLGSVNTFQDIDGVIRRQPGFVQVGTERALSFSLAVFLAYLRIPTEALPQVVALDERARLLTVTPQRTLYLDSLGLWRQNFFTPPLTVSLRDVLSGQTDPAIFADKIVLIGLINASGFIDQYPVPTDTAGNLMAGVEIHAHAIESLIQNQLPHPVNPTFWILGLSILSSLIYVHVRWYWLLPISLVLMLALALAAFSIFYQRQEMIDLFYAGLALIVPLLLNGARKLSLEIDRRQRSEFLLQSVVEISNQRLVLERILPRIAADMRRVLNSPAIAIWLYDEDADTPRLAHQWPGSASYVPMLESICRRAEGGAAIQYPCVAVPVRWQGRLLAVLTAQLPLGWNPPRAALYLLQSLADQVAPSLENAILYTEVARQKATLEAILDTSPAGIALLDSRLQPVRRNAAFEKALPDTLVLPEKFRAGEAFRAEIQIGSRTFNLEAAPLADFEQWVVILNDVTTLSELNRFKTQMIRMASHDLRNPLARIMGYSELIREMNSASLPEQSLRFLGSIQGAAEQMNAIISGILDLELARTGGVNYEPVDLREIVTEAIKHHNGDMEAHRQTFQAAVGDSAVMILGSYRQLAQAVTNLLGNAVKYTPDGGRISLRLFQPGNGLVRLEIEDTGYGISEAAQTKLFTEFYRVRTLATADIPGTGLGLSLVKSVIDSHNGRVWVKSQEGVGSTFFVELPVMKHLDR